MAKDLQNAAVQGFNTGIGMESSVNVRYQIQIIAVSCFLSASPLALQAAAQKGEEGTTVTSGDQSGNTKTSSKQHSKHGSKAQKHCDRSAAAGAPNACLANSESPTKMPAKGSDTNSDSQGSSENAEAQP